MASGINRVVTGSVKGTGSAINVTSIGFRPSYVRLINAGGLVTAEWHNDMADASMAKRVTGGTMTLPTSNGITPLSNGFTIGADSDLNASSELIHYVAFEGSSDVA